MTWRRFSRLALGVALLGLVLLSVDPSHVLARLSGANIWLVLPAVIGLTAMHAVGAAGWRAILAAVGGVHLSWRSALSLYYAAQAIGGVTPANLGGDIHRVVSLRGGGQGWRAAVAPVVIQRATSYLALSALSLAGLVVLAARTAVATSVVIAGLAFACAVAAVAWILLYPPARLRRVHARLVSLIGGRDDDGELPVPRLGPAALLGMVQGLAFHAGSIGLTWLLVLAVDPGAPGVPIVAALAVARLATAVPFSPSGLGVQEGVLGLLFVGLGMRPETALAAMVLARIALLLTTAIGALLLLRSHGASRSDARVGDRPLGYRSWRSRPG
jgi:uncharacterized membrane protein YbhN (UPF0104 family)